MRAVVHDTYGPPDVLRLQEVRRPVPKDDEVLIKIHATTVNRTDAALRAAEPFASGSSPVCAGRRGRFSAASWLE
jgi:NADPH:quinone reductase-like Zn-dependent oxidoreductase